jgi:hypothetical protein
MSGSIEPRISKLDKMKKEPSANFLVRLLNFAFCDVFIPWRQMYLCVFVRMCVRGGERERVRKLMVHE